MFTATQNVIVFFIIFAKISFQLCDTLVAPTDITLLKRDVRARCWADTNKRFSIESELLLLSALLTFPAISRIKLTEKYDWWIFLWNLCLNISSKEIKYAFALYTLQRRKQLFSVFFLIIVRVFIFCNLFWS